MNNENNLTPLQNRLLEMLDWFHHFCIENDITYYAIGGTMLGAVRHQGFIPWDDDVDVGLPRRDYEKLKTLLADKRVGNYTIEMPDSENDDFATPYAKLYDVSTTLIENYHKPLVRGVFIDVFPLDGLDDDWKRAMGKYNRIRIRYNYFMTKITSLNVNRKFYKNAAIIISRFFCLSPRAIRNLRIKIDCMCKKNDFFRCEYVGNLLGNWGRREVMSRSIMGTPMIYSFNGIEIYGVEKYDEYLTCLYGDWRKLPPKDKQVTHHGYIELDLKKPYVSSV